MKIKTLFEPTKTLHFSREMASFLEDGNPNQTQKGFGFDSPLFQNSVIESCSLHPPCANPERTDLTSSAWLQERTNDSTFQGEIRNKHLLSLQTNIL